MISRMDFPLRDNYYRNSPMASEHPIILSVITGILGLITGSGLTFLKLSISNKSGTNKSVTQKNIRAGGDFVGRDMKK